MTSPTSGRHEMPLHVVATGFTTAFLGDERTLREFIVGDHVRGNFVGRGENAVLYLINDSYDPLTIRQLRIGVAKDELLLRRFEPYCGQPIAEVPDPFGCHDSYSKHFAQDLMRRLHGLDVHPVLLDTYDAYRAGCYERHLTVTLQNHDDIRRRLAEAFPDLATQTLFRAQCPKCRRLDSTEVRRVTTAEISFRCERCETDTTQGLAEVRGKLTWKLDCAARWNIYGIGTETFSKAHFEDLGTIRVAGFMSENYYGGRIPRVIKYGGVEMTPEVSNQLLEILPPVVFKSMLTTNLERDIHLTKDFVENVCQKVHVRPGLSYVDYVRQELPHGALRGASQGEPSPRDAGLPDGTIAEGTLVAYGNRFSRFMYGKDYGLRLPDGAAFASIGWATAHVACGVIEHALSLRAADPATMGGDTKKGIKSYLMEQDTRPEVYRFLRQLLRQDEGPTIPTLLAAVPEEYLRLVHVMLTHFALVPPSTERTPDPVRQSSPQTPRQGVAAGGKP